MRHLIEAAIVFGLWLVALFAVLAVCRDSKRRERAGVKAWQELQEWYLAQTQEDDRRAR